jgi:hypothetical protein
VTSDSKESTRSTRNITKEMVVLLAFVFFSIISCSLVDERLALFCFNALPLALVFSQGVNFHHYIVDGITWKSRQQLRA